ncbi:MAG: peroxiredoxin family protein [Pirellulaceae bacterium]
MKRLATFTLCLLLACCTVAVVGRWSRAEDSAQTPQVGEAAADFTLESLGGEKISLGKLTKAGPVVLVVLRGYPGYQCPLCTRQVGELVGSAEAIAASGASVVLVYPGPGDNLTARAEEFLGKRTLPDNFTLVTDPDYTFTRAYHLRWDAVKETAYPSTFVIDGAGKIRFAQISKSHGGRTPAKTVLAELKKL